jgi:hypothetical protein
MMTASLAFALQGICVAASEAATGDSSHYYLGFAFHHAGGTHSHLLLTGMKTARSILTP